MLFRSRWNEKNVKYLIDNYENPDVSMEEIEINTKMTKAQIKTKAHELKLRRTKGLNFEITDYIRKEYYNKGAEYIANRFNIPKSSIYTYVSKNKIYGKKGIFVRIVDVVYREKIAICKSIMEAVKVMQEDYKLNVGNRAIT